MPTALPYIFGSQRLRPLLVDFYLQHKILMNYLAKTFLSVDLRGYRK
jgi:hypothetical protein